MVTTTHDKAGWVDRERDRRPRGATLLRGAKREHGPDRSLVRHIEKARVIRSQYQRRTPRYGAAFSCDRPTNRVDLEEVRAERCAIEIISGQTGSRSLARPYVGQRPKQLGDEWTKPSPTDLFAKLRRNDRRHRSADRTWIESNSTRDFRYTHRVVRVQ